MSAILDRRRYVAIERAGLGDLRHSRAAQFTVERRRAAAEAQRSEFEELARMLENYQPMSLAELVV